MYANTQTNLNSVVLDADRLAWATDTKLLYMGDGVKMISELAP